MKQVIRKFWKENAAVFLLLLGSGLSTTATGFINAAILDALIHFDFKRFGWMILWMLAAYGCFLFFTYWRIIQQTKTVQKMSTYVRTDLMDKFSKTAYTNFHQKNVGTYASWMTNDITQIEQMGFESFYLLVEGFINSFLAVVALAFIHWSLLVLVIVEVYVLLQLPKLFSAKMERTTNQVTQANEHFLAKITEYLSAYDTVLVFQKFSFILDKVRKASFELGDKKIAQSKVMSGVAVTGGLGNVIGQLSIFALTGYLALIKQISIGYISTTGSFASTIFNTVGNLSQRIAAIAGTAPIFAKFEEIPVVPTEEKADIELTSGFQVKNLAYAYDGNPIFQDINYTFDLNKKYAVVGASGSGKSTILNLLSGKFTDYSGQLMLSQNELRELSVEQIYQHLLYLDQKPYLFEGTIRENLQLGDEFSEEELWLSLKKAGLAEMVAALPQQLDSEIGESGRLLSGGQQQRLALARGILRNKKIILLDEVTANLDEKTALQIENMLVDDSSLTVIMITHQLREEISQKLDGVLRLS